MGEVLFELEQVLRSKKEQLTSAEANVLLTCKSKAIREFTVGALVGSGVGWLASYRLHKFLRVNLTGGVAVACGLWRFGSSLETCIDNILAKDGSRLQRELANIIVTKYQDNPWRMKLISKHFYSERVYDDSTSDIPKLRWRYKNYFNDSVVHGQRTQGSDTHDDSHSDSNNISHKNSNNEAQTDVQKGPDSKKNHLQSKQVPVNPDSDVMADPLDCIFGKAATEEIHHQSTGTSTTPTTVRTRSHKRSHRRHRRRHREASLDPQLA